MRVRAAIDFVVVLLPAGLTAKVIAKNLIDTLESMMEILLSH
jgi:hypothetical protein